MSSIQMKYILPIFLVTIIIGCRHHTTKENTLPQKTMATEVTVVKVKLLPLGKTSSKFVNSVYDDLKKVLDSVELLPHEEMPRSAYYAPRKRYRADTLIYWMSERANDKEVYIGITMQDISTTKGSNPDHGVMGLGFQPGNACVASDFRLRNKNNFFKVVIHELGHTAGLPHCPEKICFMRDAEGGDPTGEEKDFCEKCKGYLKSKGWKL
jgi:archaemetzincin